MTTNGYSHFPASTAGVSQVMAREMRPIKQRDLTKAMKAFKAAGFNTFELVDIASGLICRATGEGSLTPTEGDLDAELRKFEARGYG